MNKQRKTAYASPPSPYRRLQLFVLQSGRAHAFVFSRLSMVGRVFGSGSKNGTRPRLSLEFLQYSERKKRVTEGDGHIDGTFDG
jgi:hypothetical protein